MVPVSKAEFIEVDKNKIHVTKRGSGAPVVFLHGFPDSGVVWNRVIDSVCKDFCCFAIDLPGLGKSLVSRGFGFSLDHQSGFFFKLITALNIETPFHLVVHDLGAFPGLAYASDHPETVRSLTIFNADFHSDFKWYFWAKAWRTPVIGEIAMYGSSFFAFKNEMKKGSKKFTDAYLRKVYDDISFYNRRMALKYFRAWNKAELEIYEARYASNTAGIPKRVFWGEKDPYSPVGYAARFGTTDVVYFNDAGHWLMIEEPEAVISNLSEFLRNNEE